MVVLLFVLPGYSLAEIQHVKEKGIFESGSKRYYQIGRERSFVCDVSNRLSDNSAREILLLVSGIYNRPSDDKYIDVEIVDFVWNTLHQVYSGKFYNEILFTCLKYKLNSLFDHLRVPPRGNEDRTSVTLLLGGWAYEEEGVTTRVSTVEERYEGRWVTAKTNSRAQPTRKFWQEPGTVKRVRRDKVKYHHLFIHEKSFGYVSREDSIKRACDAFCDEFKGLIDYWLDHCHESSLVDSELASLMEECVSFILKLQSPDTPEKTRQLYNSSAVSVLTKKVLEGCFECSPSEKLKEQLLSFAEKNSIPFDRPKESKKKPLF